MRLLNFLELPNSYMEIEPFDYEDMFIFSKDMDTKVVAGGTTIFPNSDLALCMESLDLILVSLKSDAKTAKLVLIDTKEDKYYITNSYMGSKVKLITKDDVKYTCEWNIRIPEDIENMLDGLFDVFKLLN